MAGTAIITGGSRCIGTTRARQAAVAGYHVCINYVTHFEAADRVVAKSKALAQKALRVKADFGNAKAVAELFNACGNALGPVSFLVNNAGIIGKAAIETFNIGLAQKIGGEDKPVNALQAATNDTSIHKSSGNPDRPAMSPLGRVASADGIVFRVLWLASPGSGYVMEAVLPDRGGL